MTEQGRCPPVDPQGKKDLLVGEVRRKDFLSKEASSVIDSRAPAVPQFNALSNPLQHTVELHNGSEARYVSSRGCRSRERRELGGFTSACAEIYLVYAQTEYIKK